jgi:LPXTG cell wall anchor motif
MSSITGFARAYLVLLSLTLMLALLFVWTVGAYAQTSFEGQYGNPTASGEAALAASGHNSGSVDPSSGSTDSPASAMGVLPLTGVLPDTGGPLLPLFALGVLALGFAGILLLRRLNP